MLQKTPKNFKTRQLTHMHTALLHHYKITSIFPCIAISASIYHQTAMILASHYISVRHRYRLLTSKYDNVQASHSIFIVRMHLSARASASMQ